MVWATLNLYGFIGNIDFLILFDFHLLHSVCGYASLMCPTQYNQLITVIIVIIGVLFLRRGLFVSECFWTYFNSFLVVRPFFRFESGTATRCI